MGDHDGLLTLSTEHLVVEVDAARGAQVLRFGPPDGPNLLFRGDWAAPVPATDSVGYGRDELDWLSHYRGGWQELFPNAGAAGTSLGVATPFHGEVSYSRWRVEAADADSVTLTVAARTPLRLTRNMRLDPFRAVLYVEETVRNESELEVPFVWGHHPAFDAPPGAAVDLPDQARAVVPDGYDVAHANLTAGDGAWPSAVLRDGRPVDLTTVPEGPCERVVYVPDVPEGWAALRRPDGLAVALAWDTEVFPHMWLWHETGGLDFPWYGRSRILALEPQMAWPNDGLDGAAARDQARLLRGGESLSTWLTLAVVDANAPIVGVSRAGKPTHAG